MKLSKNKEKELMQVYEAYWAEYLNGNVDAMQSLLDDSYTQIGSAEGEVFASKKEAVQFLVDTIDQVAGKLEMRNRSTKLEQLDHLILIHEVCDLYALADKKWIFYSKFRASTLLQEKKEGWKITHQHSSFPDTKTEEGQNVAIEKIAEENSQLREAVKRRTTELEHKNRELQIEAALERVRARAMAMQNSEELGEVAILLYHELISLGIPRFFNCGFIIIAEAAGTQNGWMTQPEGTFIESLDLPFPGDTILKKRHAAWVEKLPVFCQKVGGKALERHLHYVAKHSKSANQVNTLIPFMPDPTYFYCGNFSEGYLLIVAEEELGKAYEDALARFTKVFEQTYTRFLDLQKAEAQTRESQIEAAMERIRSRAIAMRTSNELLEVALEIRIQTDLLGQQDLELSVVHLYEKDAEYFESLAAMRTPGSEGEITTHKMKFPVDATPEIQQMMKNYWAGLSQYTIELNLKQREAWQKVLETTVPDLFDQRLQFDEDEIAAEKKEYWNFTDFSGGSLLTVTYSPPTTETKELFRRAADVFDLAYKRFKDLKNAEKQAREAQIEAALERVRSRSMAMHKSEELKEVIQVVYDQFVNLNIHTEHTGFIIDYKENDDMHIWLADKNEVATEVIIPYFDCAHWNSFNDAKKNGKNFFANHLTFEEKNKFYKDLFKQTPDLPKSLLEIYLNYPGLAISTVLLENVALYIENFDGIPYSDEENDTLMRFGKVFQQTYTRFLDLQKAEAQGRESQIEMALERVRTASMTMQKGDELANVISVVFTQLKMLGIDSEGCGLNLYDGNDGMDMWMSGFGEDLHPKSFHIAYFDHPYYQAQLEAWKEPQNYMVLAFEGKLKRSMDDQTFANKDFFDLPKDIKEAFLSKEKVISSSAFMKFGMLEMIGDEALSDDQASILCRFAKVFEQAYQRFLDIEKAEAQAREAQIEAALERVRSRSMAMYKSAELADLSFELVKQVQALGVPTWFCAFNIYDNDPKGSIEWGSNGEGVFPNYRTPREGIFLRYYKAGQRGESLLINEIGEKECPGHYEYLCTLPGVGEQLLEMKEAGIPFPTSQIDHVAFFKYGYILFITFERASESHEVFKRFAKVFEQTYTRFLDLQKAEAQARESEIELALERVRARTMAMQKSEELQDTALLLFQQVEGLGVPPFACGFNIWDADMKAATAWMGSVAGLQPPFKTDSSKDVYLPIYSAAQRGESLFVIEQTGKELETHYAYLATIPTFRDIILENFKRQGVSVPTFQIIHCAFFSQGYLMFISYKPVTAYYEIFKRFAKVFEQTYTRFLDLQKAEAQAREAQIEAALERVRSKTMAMHDSADVGATVVSLSDEVLKLGLDNSIRVGIGILEGYEGMETWSANPTPNGKVDLKMGMLDMTIHPMLIGLKKAWKSGKTGYSYDYIGDDVFRYYEALNNEPEYPFQADLDSLPKNEYHKSFFYTEGILFSFAPNPISEEAAKVLDRFAKVFGQTYRRYLDLQKAEAQVREAQIEAALEKVRSQSLAMHNTSEMQQVANAIYEQLNELGFDMDAVGMSGAIEAKQDYDVWVGGVPFGTALRIPYNENTKVQRDYNKLLEERPELFTKTYTGKVKEEYINHLLTHGDFPKAHKKKMKTTKAFSTSIALAKNSSIQILRYTNRPYSGEDNEILMRFAKVFEQAYIRFRDLEKAEAQTKEAQIETALEKVRSRTMAMHKSEELAETALVLYEQFSVLGNIPDRMSICIFKEETKEIELWTTDQSGSQLNQRYSGPWELSAVMTKLYKAWKAGNDSFVEDLSGQKLKAWLKFIREELKLFVDGSNIKGRRVQQAAFFSHGMLLFTTNEPVTEEIMQLLVRFAKVFSQTYTRFLDLQKAEAQAREAQIENALEKVRSRTMAMHNSNELREVVGEFFRQAEQLGFEIQMFVIFIFKPNGGLEWWGTEFGEEGLPQSYDIPPLKEFKSYPRGRNLIELRKGKKPYDVYELTGKECKIWTKILLEKTGLKQLPARIKKRLKSVDKIVLSDAVCKYGIIEVAGPVVLSREKGEILQRFAKVFEQTYTRFLDVQKAEAQAREAQIETALERVRSRTMAMQKSDELLDAAEILSAELVNLEIPHFMSGFVLINETAEKQGVHMGVPGKGRQAKFYLPLKGDAVLKKRYKSWKNAEPIFYQRVEGEKLAAHMAYVTQHFGSDEMVETGRKIPDPVIFYCGNFKEGYLHILSEVYLNEEQESILARFTKIFQQTYTRFLDLQKAEAQAREAQIENALEKVRSRTMAMQNSYELPEAANDLFLQVQALGIPAWSAGYCIWETKDKKAASCNMSSEGEIQKSFILPTIGEGYNFYDPLQKGETFYVEELGGDALVKHYNFMRTLPTVGKILDELIAAGLSLPTFQIFHILYFPQGYLMFITYEQVPDAHEIFKRFAKVFEQTYTRFLDLQKAEAQAREATKQASLDRVRGQIASMRTAADLERITPLVWNELTTMEVPFIRCGVFIMHEPKEIVEVYLSAPDGHSLGVLHLQFNADPLTANTVAHWRKGTIFKEHWNRDEFLSWTKSLIEQGQISNIKTYQGAANPPESLNLHFIPFTQGMLYVGSENPLNVEQIELVQSLADAFAIAYARYEDFTKLEKAKESVEKTLTELKATQNQLVQSEKMASLGELTAGIAHEIQNPLNFVNNFSEVSKELLEEMMEEFEKGDKEEAFAIVEDIKRNLEKINHHGQRADGIVKGMLQHSSTSSGEKEPTDINVLADEYLRLAYHGLRAKDKSFNATMKTAYDDSLEKVNVIPQDIGRVILNLITNAFYACTERSRSATNEKSSSANSSKEALAKLEASGDTKYEPTVTVSTKKTKEGVEIRVKDNGNGIPEGIKEKIFQPFFTTKPTGQGTGLGLSLSYDIVKAHGGELKVETKEGKGTEFKMKLPI